MIYQNDLYNLIDYDVTTPLPFIAKKHPLSRSLLQSLQEGGYILYARHAEATVGNDLPNLNFWNCSTQRNLSQIGRMQAITYGNTLRNFGIPIMYPVFTSPFCRNRETALLAFGEAYVQIEPFLVHLYNLSSEVNPTQIENTLSYLSSYLEVPPALGTNKVIIGHSFPEGIGLGPIQSMGTVFIRPLGQGRGYEVLGQLSLTEFTNLY